MSTYLDAKYYDRARTPRPVDNAGQISDVWTQILGLAQPDEVRVTDDTVRGLPALDRAKNLVVQSVAAMLVAADVVDAVGNPIAKPDVIRRPHPLIGAFEFYENVVDQAIMHGNWIGIRFEAGLDTEQLVPVPLGGVSLDVSTGLPVYTIGGRTYRWNEVVHVRAHAPTGTFWGRGVVERFRLGLSEALHSQAYGEASFRTGALPSVSVQLDVDVPTDEQVTATKTSMMTKFGGGKREPLVHGRALNVNPLSWSPHDAEYVESRKITLAEAALMVGLRPEDIGATLGGSLTYGNRADDSVQRIVDGYTPWLERIEGPFSDILDIGEVRGNPDALLRLTPEQSEDVEAKRLENESRRRALDAPAETPGERPDPQYQDTPEVPS
ncbi:MAG: phage portal protein [Actinomycetota bacterium]